MSAGHGHQRDRDLKHQEATPASRPAPEPDLPADMLSEIVAHTASQLATPEQIDPALREALRDVARRFAGQPMTVEPAGTALLEAVLRLQLPELASRPPLLAKTARTVAESVLADPAARLRVEHLWATLAEQTA
jgi:hypothetical protein